MNRNLIFAPVVFFMSIAVSAQSVNVIPIPEIMRERRKCIKALRQEILETNRNLQPTGSKSSEELESELFSLLALGSLPEEKSDAQETENLSSLQKSAPPENWQVPGILTAPGTDSGPRVEFFCPISADVMTDPVMPADGFSYERKAIEQWIRANNKQGHVNSPKTGLPLEHLNLIPNHVLRDRIKAFWSQLMKITKPVSSLLRVAKTQPIGTDPLSRVTQAYTGPADYKKTGFLDWELGQKGSKKMSFEEANAYAKSREGWRLPTIWELDALFMQRDVLGEDLDTDCFWSGTAVANDFRRWYLDFETGRVMGYFPDKDSLYKVRLVKERL
ncbi:MAG: U-box domain-containing protein [Myxococcaceae bacterium]